MYFIKGSKERCLEDVEENIVKPKQDKRKRKGNTLLVGKMKSNFFNEKRISFCVGNIEHRRGWILNRMIRMYTSTKRIIKIVINGIQSILRIDDNRT